LDSLSQIVLGAAVGEIALGKKLGNRGQLIGAIAGTIPDLDVFLNPLFTDEITKLQIHRGYSHSMFVHLLLAVPFAWLCHIIFKKRFSFRLWYITWYLCFLTHTLLDCCTTYGTQLLLPFTNYLVGFNNIAVVDPFWTLPFMFILIVCLFLRRENPVRIKWAYAAVAYCLLYMGYTVVNKNTVHNLFAADLEQQNIHTDALYTSPSMFNNWLWDGIAVTNDTIYLAEYSTLQKEKEVKWVSYARNLDLLKDHPARREIEVLQWFSQGKYLVQEVNGELHFFIVKWGRADFRKTEAHEAFVFYWRLFQQNGVWQAAPVEPDWGEGEFTEAWNALWKRVKTSEGF
jgi:inner membrane protein